MPELIVVGGGLAGSEAAWQAAQKDIHVSLFEMRPKIKTGAHASDNLGELVCSNSLGSAMIDRAPGLLKEELRRMGSLLIKIADECAIPAGGALAVDRETFSKRITEQITHHPMIQVVREEVRSIPNGPAIIASGPLTSESLSKSIMDLTGVEHLYFYDAIAPIVTYDSIDMSVAFRASRYGRGEQGKGDYINCPLSESEYDNFLALLLSAERVELREFERPLAEGVRAGADRFFEGCLPIEILAQRGRDALTFGPMRPVGLNDPRTGRHPFAVLQLRQDNLAGSLYNLVGFQTNLKISEQARVLRTVPGLVNAEFARYGQMHRNTFIFSPSFLRPTMQYRDREDLFFAGQITGVEGYAGNIATGLLAGLNAGRVLTGESPIILPDTTMIGALCNYVTHAGAVDFQPMKANFGLLPPLADETTIRDKRKRYQAYAQRALDALVVI